MSVRENVRFGLQVRGMTRPQQDERIGQVLDLVQMDKLGDRKPNQLSGGQQQRVALARALAVRPACLLLDEPLSNLDAKLRHEMRSEIRRICKTAGFTTIYVTHDQKEALSVADRIAILRDGKLAQVGTPGELYHRPNSAFVADFIGQTNLLPGKVLGHEAGRLRIENGGGGVVMAMGADGAAGRRAQRAGQHSPGAVENHARRGTGGSQGELLARQERRKHFPRRDQRACADGAGSAAESGGRAAAAGCQRRGERGV